MRPDTLRWMHLAVGVGLLLTCPTTAHACVCIGSGLIDLMPAEDGARPPNARIRLLSLSDEPGPVVVLEDGVSRDDVNREVELHGETFLLTLSTDHPFTPGAVVEVILPESQEAPILRFTVGAEPDETPPSWDGAFTVNNHRGHPLLRSTDCEPARGHFFEWIDLQDNVWPVDELLVVGVADVDGGPVSFVGLGDFGSVFESMGESCSHDDSTLLTDFHRTYDVFVEDGSGNRIGPFEVNTRAGCGCASSTPVAAGVWTCLVALATVRRRRVRS